MHDGDLAAQTSLTLEVISAILHAQGFAWADVDRSVGYAKHADGVEPTATALAGLLGAGAACSTVQADICRPELLVEIEVDACLR